MLKSGKNLSIDQDLKLCPDVRGRSSNAILFVTTAVDARCIRAQADASCLIYRSLDLEHKRANIPTRVPSKLKYIAACQWPHREECKAYSRKLVGQRMVSMQQCIFCCPSELLLMAVLERVRIGNGSLPDQKLQIRV